MFKIFIVFIVILILLFPIKIKLTIFFNGKTLNIKLFRFSLINKNIGDIKLGKKRDNSKKKDKKAKKKLNIFKKININFSNVIYDLNKNRFKPKITINNSFKYSTEDAAFTAIAFGIISSFMFCIYRLINIIFKLKIKETTIEPIFIFENSVTFSFKSIITFNIVQIIIMLGIVLKNLKFKGGTQ